MVQLFCKFRLATNYKTLARNSILRDVVQRVGDGVASTLCKTFPPFLNAGILLYRFCGEGGLGSSF